MFLRERETEQVIAIRLRYPALPLPLPHGDCFPVSRVCLPAALFKVEALFRLNKHQAASFRSPMFYLWLLFLMGWSLSFFQPFIPSLLEHPPPSSHQNHCFRNSRRTVSNTVVTSHKSFSKLKKTAIQAPTVIFLAAIT